MCEGGDACAEQRNWWDRFELRADPLLVSKTWNLLTLYDRNRLTLWPQYLEYANKLKVTDPGGEPRSLRKYVFVANRVDKRLLTIRQSAGREGGAGLMPISLYSLRNS